MSPALPRLSVRGALREALSADALTRLPSEVLSAFLRERRWFGAKGRAPGEVRLRDTIRLFEGSNAIARIEVDAGRPEAATYQLPLAVRAGEPAEPGAPRAVVALLESDEGPGFLFDAVEDDEFRRRLGGALARGARFDGERSSWTVEPIEPGPYADEETRLVGGEQSNTSISFGQRAIFKLYRRITAGENPEVEIGEFLSRHAQFTNVPRLLATVRFDDQDGSSAVAGMLQQFIPSLGDGWSYALARARAEAGGSSSAERPFHEAAERLGQITRRLHEALAADRSDPAFAPLAVTSEEVGGWGERVAAQVKRGSERLVERAAAGALHPQARKLAADCLSGLPKILSHVRSIAASLGDQAGSRIRHHGDYHLGQVLVAANDDFVILDFEGEPTRPLAERRERRSPLRDVAGMLRSFSYAAAVTARELENRPGTEERLREWEQRARHAFVAGYLGRELADFLPPSPAAVRRLLSLFEIEKVFYELGYEIDHRPDWVHVPLQGVRKLVDEL